MMGKWDSTFLAWYVRLKLLRSTWLEPFTSSISETKQITAEQYNRH